MKIQLLQKRPYPGAASARAPTCLEGQLLSIEAGNERVIFCIRIINTKGYDSDALQ